MLRDPVISWTPFHLLGLKGGKANQAFLVYEGPKDSLGIRDSEEPGGNRESVDLRGTKGPADFLA